MKRYIKVFTSIGVGVCLVACSKKQEIYKIELAVGCTGSDFIKSVYEGASAAAGKYNIELTCSAPEDTGTGVPQHEMFYEYLEQDLDGIVLVPNDYYLMEEPVNDAKVPVVLVDGLVKGDGWENFVLTDNYQIGVTLGEQVIERYGTEGQVGIINFSKTAWTALEREEGLVDTLEAKSELEVVDILDCGVSIEKAKQQAYELMATYPDLKAIIGLNAQSTTGICRAVEESEGEDYFVAGIDCIVEQANAIENGVLEVTILQNPYMMGYYGVESAYKLLEGEKIENKYVGTYIIDKESLFSKESQELIFPFE